MSETLLNDVTMTLAEDASGLDSKEGRFGGLRITLVRPARLRDTTGVEFLPAKVAAEDGTPLWEFQKHPSGRWDRAYLVEVMGEPLIAHVAVKKRLVTFVLPVADLPKIVTTAPVGDGDEEPVIPRTSRELAELKFRAARTLGMNAAFTAREMEVVPLLEKTWNRELDLAARRALAEGAAKRLAEEKEKRAEREEQERALAAERLEAKRKAEAEAAALNAFRKSPIPAEPLVVPVAVPSLPPATPGAVATEKAEVARAATAPARAEALPGARRHRESGKHKLGERRGTNGTPRPDRQLFVRVPELRVRADGTIVEVTKLKKNPLVHTPEEQEKRRLANIAARAAARAARKAKKSDRMAARLAAKAAEKKDGGKNKKEKTKRG